MSEPSKHHYLPVFYTKRWAGAEGRLVAYRKWPSGVRYKWHHPSGIGWARDLYALKDLPPELTQQLEAKFMSPVDSQAAEALRLIEERAGPNRWTSELRQAWVRFIRSLWLRMPADIETLKRKYAERLTTFSDDEQAMYESVRKPGDPPTIAEWFARHPESYAANRALALVPQLADGRFITELLMNWHWFVMEVTPGDHDLMTSDRPVRTSALMAEDAYLKMPIGPRRMFWCVRHPKWEDHLRRNLRRDWASKQNTETVRGAHELVIARTPAAHLFVQRNMAAEPLRSHFDIPIEELKRVGASYPGD